MKKQYVHNLMEVRALVKEAFSRGEESFYEDTAWLSHAGDLLCKTRVGLIEFEMILPDKTSLTIEVLE